MLRVMLLQRQQRETPQATTISVRVSESVVVDEDTLLLKRNGCAHVKRDRKPSNSSRTYWLLQHHWLIITQCA